MKNLLLITFLLGFISSNAQFDPKGRIPEPKNFSEKSYNFFMSKRLKRATWQRDSLQQLTTAFNTDTAERGLRYRELSDKYNELDRKHKALQVDYTEMNAKYTELIRSSLNKTEQLNSALREKGELLLAREKRLMELEALIKRQDSITNALNDLVKKALLSFNSEELTVEMKNGKVYVSMSDKLLFKSGKAEVEEKGKEAIKKLADVLAKNPDIAVLIEGHTDSIPIRTEIFKDNWDLSTARATNIVRLLSDAHKIDPRRLTAAGRGEFYPRASNASSEGRAKNRRTEIILSPKLDELYKLIEKR